MIVRVGRASAIDRADHRVELLEQSCHCARSPRPPRRRRAPVAVALRHAAQPFRPEVLSSATMRRAGLGAGNDLPAEKTFPRNDSSLRM